MNYTCQFCGTETHEANTRENTRGLVLSREKWCLCCRKTTFHFARRDKEASEPMRFGQEAKLRQLRS